MMYVPLSSTRPGRLWLKNGEFHPPVASQSAVFKNWFAGAFAYYPGNAIARTPQKSGHLAGPFSGKHEVALLASQGAAVANDQDAALWLKLTLSQGSQ